MIFENFYWSLIGIWLYNNLIEAFVYSNYNDFANVELMRIEIL